MIHEVMRRYASIYISFAPLCDFVDSLPALYFSEPEEV
jgi:hypothetical protein